MPFTLCLISLHISLFIGVSIPLVLYCMSYRLHFLYASNTAMWLENGFAYCNMIIWFLALQNNLQAFFTIARRDCPEDIAGDVSQGRQYRLSSLKYL